MDFPLGKSPCGPACPCTDILFTSELAEDLLSAMDCALALLTIVTAVSVQLRSLLDCSGHLQESSRKHVLLQATYLPRRKNTIAHSFGPFSFILAIVSLAKRRSKFFLCGWRINPSHADLKNEGCKSPYLFHGQNIRRHLPGSLSEPRRPLPIADKKTVFQRGSRIGASAAGTER